MTLTPAQLDRAVGVLLGTAAGDALGAAYEFGPPRGPQLEVAMVGGGGFGWEPGEWTDDTSMAIAIAEVAATGADLREEEALDAIVRRWHEWSRDAKDVGVQTRSVLSRAGRHGISAQTARAESAGLHKLSGRTAGPTQSMATHSVPVRLTLPDGVSFTSDDARFAELLTGALGRPVTPASAALSEPSLEEYWPDIAELAHRETVTQEAMPSTTFFDLAAIHVLTTATINRLRELYPQGQFEVRRFRPNIVVRPENDDAEFVESTRVGRKLGSATTSCSRSPTTARAA